MLVVEEQRIVRRHRFEIVVGILELCSDWSKPTPMLSTLQVNQTENSKLLTDLVERDMLEKKTVLKRRRTGSHMLSDNPQGYSRCLYRRTLKGSEFLRLWKLLMKIWNGVV